MEHPLDSPVAAGLDFDPVPLRARRDGWTPERQRHFIRVLRETGCVARACQAVGRTRASVYRLYLRPDAESFRRAWDAATAAGRAARVTLPPRRVDLADTHEMRIRPVPRAAIGYPQLPKLCILPDDRLTPPAAAS